MVQIFMDLIFEQQSVIENKIPSKITGYTVHDDLPRGFWKIGCIERLLSGRDETVRGATVRVTTNGKCTTLDRPLQRLYPMEIKSTSTEIPT